MSFGYSSDIDVVVNGVSLMKSLGFIKVEPKFTDKINNLKQLAQTFGYFFQQGSGSEIRLNEKESFDQIKEKAMKKNKYIELGGNAVTMALRAQKEGCKVLLGCAMNEYYYNKYFNDSENKAELSSGFTNITDYHLVLDFDTRERWSQLKSKRSNRFYLNYDIDNVNLSYMKNFHESEKNFQSDIIVLGGFQLIQNVEFNIYDQLFQQVKSYIIDIDYAKIHVELGSFFDQQLLNSLTNNVLMHSQSLGFNEQELSHLKLFLSDKKLEEKINAIPEVQNTINDLVDLIALLEKKMNKIERIHFHSLKFQAICNDQQWGNPKVALSHSNMIAPLISLYNYEYSINNLNQNQEQIDKFIELTTYDFPTSLFLNDIYQQTIEVKTDFKDPIMCWNASRKFQCCVAPMIFSKYPLRTRGLGDNISAIGLIYHKKLY